MSRSWHAALTAAPELVPTARLSCLFDVETDAMFDYRGEHGTGPSPAAYFSCCPKLRRAMAALQRLSPRTLRVRLEGFDWYLVRRKRRLFACSHVRKRAYHLRCSIIPAAPRKADVRLCSTQPACNSTCPAAGAPDGSRAQQLLCKQCAGCAGPLPSSGQA